MHFYYSQFQFKNTIQLLFVMVKVDYLLSLLILKSSLFKKQTEFSINPKKQFSYMKNINNESDYISINKSQGPRSNQKALYTQQSVIISSIRFTEHMFPFKSLLIQMNYQQKLQSNPPILLFNYPLQSSGLEGSILNTQGKGTEKLTQKHMKQLVQQIRFKQKMEAINKRKGKYKRSTNNCHKKYIGILKNLVFLKLNAEKKSEILSQFAKYRNSRVYYFIILCYLKWYLQAMDVRWVFQHFCQEVQAKVSRFRLEIKTTSNSNFIRFRKDEIIELEYSLQSVNHFLRGSTEESIRVLYQKNKYIIIKRNEYLRTLQIVKELQGSLQKQRSDTYMQDKLASLSLGELYHWNRVITFNDLDAIEQIAQNKMKEEGGDSSPESDQKESQEQEAARQSEEAALGENKGADKRIKQQQNQADTDAAKYPLLALQNSYRIITQANWYNWIIQKQKILQFSIRQRENQLMKNAQYNGFDMHRSLMLNNPWGITHYQQLN